jgi:hypothetical protein
MTHEAYPGHHLEHASKEAALVDGQGRLEASILLINTPDCLISEGLADLGERFVAPPEDRVELLVELFEERFDPSRYAGAAGPDRTAAEEAVADRIEKALDAVKSLDQDRIIRAFLGVIRAALRTNYFQEGIYF